MTQSLAQDGDLEYTKQDLYRYYKHFNAGPLGIFLKKGKEGKIFYAKSFVYALFAAPFVKIFGINGFLVFHSVLLFLLLFMGYSYLRLGNSDNLALITTLTFIFASIAWIYFIWISPDFFNMVLIFSILFLCLYKTGLAEANKAKELNQGSSFKRFLLSDWSDYTASILAGVAVFSKPPNIVLLAPLVLIPIFKKKLFKTFAVLIIFLLTSAAFWGSNYLITEDWNYQGGERKTFYFKYPLEKEDYTFDSLGKEMTAEGYGQRHLFPLKVSAYNAFYYFFGRFTGITWYFFPAVAFLVLFFISRKKWTRWILLAALSAEIVIYIVLMPDNYAGGGGALANRYFLNIFPFFFFLPPLKRNLKDLVSIWLAACLFISPILITPWKSSQFPSTHAKKLPFKLFPVELTLVNNIPTNTNPNAFRQEVGTHPHIGWLHFLDDNFLPRLERNGFWTRGPYEAEMVLKTYYPVEKLIFNLLNNPRMRNNITVEVEGQKKSLSLGHKQWGALEFQPGKGFKMRAIHLYKIKVKAEKGSIPYFEDETSDERRFLGVFFKIDIIPQE